ncbi:MULTISPECIES: gas vesicle accessory protein GvpU [unclassified Sphingomonas]|uniref:gas vesicle accessory protein GvpU n=1 Tax=Novosphingobium rhizosphaerae TaxID=1551649 RepID=UPI0015C6CA1C
MEDVENNENLEGSIEDFETLNHREIPENVDWFLVEGILDFAELDTNIPITININGMVVSGVSISAREYLEGMRGVMRSMFGEKNEKIVDMVIDGSLEVYPTRDELLRKGHISRGYLHLKDAQYFSGGQPIPTEGGVLWRGKLASIDGFSWGQFKTGK